MSSAWWRSTAIRCPNPAEVPTLWLGTERISAVVEMRHPGIWVMGDLTEVNLEASVALAGLGEAIARPYATYSHGMRYRLGLAQALLGGPELLVLDEPTTGLDPAHIREVRATIRAQAARGATVIMASHLLSEVEEVCTHAAIMLAGRLIATGSVDDLTAPTRSISIEVIGDVGAADILADVDGVESVSTSDHTVLVKGAALRPGDLFSVLGTAGVSVRAFRRGQSLEGAYLGLLAAAQRPPIGGGGAWPA